MGSDLMPRETKVKLSTAFELLAARGIKILWKWHEDDFTSNKILFKKWLPQQDILGKLSRNVIWNKVELYATYFH